MRIWCGEFVAASPSNRPRRRPSRRTRCSLSPTCRRRRARSPRPPRCAATFWRWATRRAPRRRRRARTRSSTASSGVECRRSPSTGRSCRSRRHRPRGARAAERRRGRVAPRETRRARPEPPLHRRQDRVGRRQQDHLLCQGAGRRRRQRRRQLPPARRNGCRPAVGHHGGAGDVCAAAAPAHYPRGCAGGAPQSTMARALRVLDEHFAAAAQTSPTSGRRARQVEAKLRKGLVFTDGSLGPATTLAATGRR